MANLTVGTIPKATGAAQIDDSPISDHGAAGISFLGVDGSAAVPATTTFGFAVSYNKEGFGEVDFWNLALPAPDQTAFSFKQKIGPGTYVDIVQLYTDGSTYGELDIVLPDGSHGISISAMIGGGAGIGSDLAFLQITPPTQVHGTTTNDAAPAGYSGEYVSSTILTASPVPLVSGAAKTITSIALTAGDWDVSGTVAFKPAAGTTSTKQTAGVSLTDNALPTNPGGGYVEDQAAYGATLGATLSVGTSRISLAAPATVYLVAQQTFAVSTSAAFGFIGARRAR